MVAKKGKAETKRKSTAKKKTTAKSTTRKKRKIPQIPTKLKYDYDSEEKGGFLDLVEQYARQAMTDAGIAMSLDITPAVFSRMKNGKYDGWTDVENARRSEKICQRLTNARAKMIGAVRSALFRKAIGGRMLKTVRYVQQRCPCNGQDRQCPDCGGTGYITLTDKTIVQETEEMSSLQAQALFLHHYDDVWRSRQSGNDDDSIPDEPKRGVNIEDWIKKEMEDMGYDT